MALWQCVDAASENALSVLAHPGIGREMTILEHHAIPGKEPDWAAAPHRRLALAVVGQLDIGDRQDRPPPLIAPSAVPTVAATASAGHLETRHHTMRLEAPGSRSPFLPGWGL